MVDEDVTKVWLATMPSLEKWRGREPPRQVVVDFSGVQYDARRSLYMSGLMASSYSRQLLVEMTLMRSVTREARPYAKKQEVI